MSEDVLLIFSSARKTIFGLFFDIAFSLVKSISHARTSLRNERLISYEELYPTSVRKLVQDPRSRERAVPSLASSPTPASFFCSR